MFLRHFLFQTLTFLELFVFLGVHMFYVFVKTNPNLVALFPYPLTNDTRDTFGDAHMILVTNRGNARHTNILKTVELLIEHIGRKQTLSQWGRYFQTKTSQMHI